MRHVLIGILVVVLYTAPAAAFRPYSSDLSPAGQQVFKEHYGKGLDPAYTALSDRKKRLHEQMDQVLATEPYDEQRLAATMRELRKVQNQLQEHGEQSMLALLRKLPDEDRRLFLKSMMTPKPPIITSVTPAPNE